MDFLNDLFKYKNHSTVCGLTDELSILYYYNYFINNSDNLLIVTNSLYDSNKIFQKLKTYTDDVCLFPMDDFLASVALAISPDLKVKRLETLEYIKTHKSIVVTNLMGYLRFLPGLNEKNKYDIDLKIGSYIKRDELINNLTELGYTRESLVTTTGEYAVRGFICDIFPIEEDKPIRIEFFGDEVESIRYFDPDTQLSLENINNIKILPFTEIDTDSKSSIYDYLNNPYVFFVDYNQILDGYNKIIVEERDYRNSKDIDQDFKFMFDFNDINVEKYIKIETFNNLTDAISYNSKPCLKFNGNYDNFKDFVLNNINKYTVVICLSNQKQIDSISSLFDSVSLNTYSKGIVNIINKKINEGFIFDKYLFISEYDIDDIKNVVLYNNKIKIGKKIKSFNDIKIGDYVVHQAHGVGIYGGIKAIAKGDLVRDYILINYNGNDKVYIPVEKINTIYKYGDADTTNVKLNSLNSTQWQKTKLRVKNRIKDISDELINLYAKRSQVNGDTYKTFPEEIIFANNFIYTATDDQIRCSTEIDNDLKTKVPMDRLLCGDVGFGKTEVAFRAMFKTILNGHQVAYLCPTTLLSRQQYMNVLERFKDYPINIGLLNRFVSVKETNRIIDGLKNGTIDVVIGTHKLLNDKIEYKNLGLLVIDEEQRFGVTHKEKIKKLKNDVNVLTLSATPIPRTLKMAMSGLRDLSIIDTPPVDRYPIQTYVIEENDVLIKDAIYKELSRNGQVFLLYNKIQSIMDEYDRIKKLVPEARICVAHGQMDKSELEKIVTDYVDGLYDILICTTIIETGIDIPNVNTLIVIDADTFGLSQLYQLRGRVGRSNKIAYAYLMYKKSKLLTETAKKRLQSIKDFTELGSGYKIAMRDLSIRGAGDLLGSEQAGFIDAVGIDLYTKMVQEEISKLNGDYVDDEETLNPLIEVENHISDDFVSDEDIKIEIHKMINDIKDKASLEKTKSEIIDRFGSISEQMEIYMYEEWFEKLASKLGIKRVRETNELIEIELPVDVSNKLEGDKLFLIAYNISPKYKLSYKMKKIYLTLPKKLIDKHFIYYEVKLLDEILHMVEEYVEK